MTDYAFKLQVEAPNLAAGNSSPWYRVEGRYLPGAVFMRLGFGPNGQLVCTGIYADSPNGEISTSALRNIPINKLLSGIIDQFGLGDPVWKAMEDVELPPVGPSGIGRGLVWSATPTVESANPHRGGIGPKQDRLKRFAESYKHALNATELRHKPIAYASDEMGISPATAHRWRAECVKKGLLDPPANK